MPDFESFDGARLRYELSGDGKPAVLLHGFASDGFINWVRSGMVDALTEAGYHAIVPDLRGHGGSAKPHDAEAYADEAMVRDVTALLDHLELGSCQLVGYSMGAWLALGVMRADDRPVAAVCGGIGGAMLSGGEERRERIASALEADDPSTIDDPVGRSFRDFAKLTGADRKALAALQRGRAARAEGFEDVTKPLLFVCGDNDPMAGSPGDLASRFPSARAAVVGGSHLNVVNNPDFHREVIAFLDEHSEGR